MVFKVLPYGDAALHVQLHEGISEQGFQRVQYFFTRMNNLKDHRILELIPTYHSVTVLYRPNVSYQEMLNLVEEVYYQSLKDTLVNRDLIRRVEIPVCYGEEFGPDLEYVAKYNGLSTKEVIDRHSAPEYLIYMLGFMPGFPYMGGLDPKLATPRLSRPRSRVPQGSVGIAGQQTGLYPLTSPGGWQLIGRTPLSLFDAKVEPPTFLLSGDRVKFVPISPVEYEEMKGKKQ